MSPHACRPVRRTPSQLRRVSAAANAATVEKGDYVTIHYVGTLDDGTVFDSTRKEGKSPFSYVVGDPEVRS
jgi:FKBP-type peptidyl-prolyl cis-trans isomerase